MKLKIFSLLIAVLMSTAVLTACNKAPAGAESSGGSGESLSTAQGGEPSASESGAQSGAQNENSADGDRTESSEQKKTQAPINLGERGSVRASCSDIREFVLSKEAARLVLSLASGDFTLAEPCAYYENIATYRISDGNNTAYCTFRIEKSDEYTVEALSSRGPDYVEGVEGEFYPTLEDGYPKEAFAALALKDVYSDEYDFDSAEKVEYVITAVGSGQATAVEDEIRRMREAVESVRLLPIERFITDDYGVKFISNRFSYYKNADDEEPYCIIYTNLVSVETASGLNRIYYPENPEEYYRRVTDVYFAILDERLKNAQSP